MNILNAIQGPCQWSVLVFMVLTLPVFFVFMVTLFKYRKIEPLNSMFFRIMFSLGVVDFISLLLYYPRLLTNTTDRHRYVCPLSS